MGSKQAATVLVVDDEKLQAETTGRFLSLQGISTKIFTDPRAALSWLGTNYRDVAVVLLDYKMPEVNGRMFLRELREISAAPRVALVTGFRPQDLPPLGKFGVERFFKKPVRLEEIWEWVNRQLGRRYSTAGGVQ